MRCCRSTRSASAGSTTPRRQRARTPSRSRTACAARGCASCWLRSFAPWLDVVVGAEQVLRVPAVLEGLQPLVLGGAERGLHACRALVADEVQVQAAGRP